MNQLLEDVTEVELLGTQFADTYHEVRPNLASQQAPEFLLRNHKLVATRYSNELQNNRNWWQRSKHSLKQEIHKLISARNSG